MEKRQEIIIDSVLFVGTIFLILWMFVGGGLHVLDKMMG